MKNIAMTGIFVFIILVLTNCVDSKSGVLPSRSECIVKIIMDWSPRTQSYEREKIIDDISSAIMFSAAKGGPNIKSNQAFPRNQRNVLYLQFKSDCKKRFTHARKLMEYVKENVPESPGFRVLDEIIQPGVNTIDVWGPEWRDNPIKTE